MTSFATAEAKGTESLAPKFAFLIWIFVIITIQWILCPPYGPLLSAVLGYAQALVSILVSGEQMVQEHGQELLLKLFSAQYVF